MQNSFMIIFILVVFSACTASKEELVFEKPEIQIPRKSPEPLTHQD